MGRSIGVSALTVLTIGLSLAVLASFAVVVDNLRRLASDLGQQVGVSAYLEPGLDGAPLADRARQWQGVAEAYALSSMEAMAEFRAQLGSDAVLLDGLPEDVLPPSVELRLEPKRWTVAEVRDIAHRLAEESGVTDVRFGQEDVERVAALLGVTRVAAFVLGLALCFATVLIIYNTIRLTLYARRDEIEIMTLVGATAGFVRAPFVLEGALQGILGGLAAAAGLFALEEALLLGLERGLAFAGSTTAQLSFVPASATAGLVLAGAALGILGSVLAVGKFLRI